MTTQPPGQLVGYARISTASQHLDRQHADLADVDKLFTDTASGSGRARPGLDAALAYLRDGDTLRVSSMDRLARSLVDLRHLVDELTDAGVTVEFVKESTTYRPGKADPRSTLMLNLLGAFAEFERALIRERQAEGIAAAKAAGKYAGRSRKLRPEQVQQARHLIASGVPVARVARQLDVSRATLYRALARELAASDQTRPHTDRQRSSPLTPP